MQDCLLVVVLVYTLSRQSIVACHRPTSSSSELRRSRMGCTGQHQLLPQGALGNANMCVCCTLCSLGVVSPQGGMTNAWRRRTVLRQHSWQVHITTLLQECKSTLSQTGHEQPTSPRLCCPVAQALQSHCASTNKTDNTTPPSTHMTPCQQQYHEAWSTQRINKRACLAAAVIAAVTWPALTTKP